MATSFWERDAAYRRRISIIVPIVVTAYAVLFFTTDRIRYEDIPRMVGWKGELQLMPEITVVSEINSAEAEPMPKKVKAVPQTMALDLAPVGEIRDAPEDADVSEVKPRAAKSDEEAPIDRSGEGTAPVRSMEKTGRPETSYSDTFVLVKYVKPGYPPLERAEGIEGTVTVEMLVDEFGVVAEANALSRVGPENFEYAALDAARQFLFEPPMQNGKPARIWVQLRFVFRIVN
jgi:TonB family protein